jgi:hypothetical protein
MSKIADLDERLHRVGYDFTLRQAATPAPIAQTRKIYRVGGQASA